MNYQATDPRTSVVGEGFELHDQSEVARVLERSVGAWAEWRKTTFAERAAVLHQLAETLRTHEDRYAASMTNEMGKLPEEARAEVQKCAWVCEHYAEHGASYLAPKELPSDGSWSGVHHQPLGMVLAVMPWNFPFWQVMRFGAPALMAGNGFLLKHASCVPQCAIDLEELFQSSGIPHGLVANLRLTNDGVEALLEDDRIAALTVTGSVRAGKELAALAGAQLKPSVLELGGSDPFVVFADADVAKAASVAVKSRFLNGGQSCIAAKRWIVESSVLPAFREAALAAMRELHLPPMAREDLRAGLHEQVVESVAAGARLVVGGEMPEGAGWFYPATLLDGVEPGMPAFDQELFGPVATLIEANDADHAIELANTTVFGLGACAFTQSKELADRAINELSAGAVFINGMVKSDPRIPFGGIRESGWGRELAGAGIRAFTNAKTVWRA